MTATFISLDHPILVLFWWRPGLCCSHTGYLPDKGPSSKVPAPFMLLFLIISELISLIFRVVIIRCHNHQYVYWGLISRKIVRQDWRAPTAHETWLFPAGRKSSIYVPHCYYYYYDYCYNWTRTQNHLVRKWTLNHLASLARWLSVCLWTKWFWIRVQLQSLQLHIPRLFQARSSLTFRQL